MTSMSSTSKLNSGSGKRSSTSATMSALQGERSPPSHQVISACSSSSTSVNLDHSNITFRFRACISCGSAPCGQSSMCSESAMSPPPSARRSWILAATCFWVCSTRSSSWRNRLISVVPSSVYCKLGNRGQTSSMPSSALFVHSFIGSIICLMPSMSIESSVALSAACFSWRYDFKVAFWLTTSSGAAAMPRISRFSSPSLRSDGPLQRVRLARPAKP
mmetsp:Transcript_2807/g.7421  ORF Transcript_2807/g.7421 Transcript_2807/m.7421 type:complete len:218 (-) Transcript_2807:366-1019(-)